ncbi:hypothetical protein M5K25_004923 [Dendrobium thyrsiflorum]|uniref:Uncharacterized protein n=1 Tax=Dendrobium thyrsiflorum TaxID=117978 RepID=A0ABD0VG73_DENTH
MPADLWDRSFLQEYLSPAVVSLHDPFDFGLPRSLSLIEEAAEPFFSTSHTSPALLGVDKDLLLVGFLTLWLSTFVLQLRTGSLRYNVLLVASQLSESQKLALAPVVLARVYGVLQTVSEASSLESQDTVLSWQYLYDWVHLHVQGAFSCLETSAYFLHRGFPIVLQLSQASSTLESERIRLFFFAPYLSLVAGSFLSFSSLSSSGLVREALGVCLGAAPAAPPTVRHGLSGRLRWLPWPPLSCALRSPPALGGPALGGEPLGWGKSALAEQWVVAPPSWWLIFFSAAPPPSDLLFFLPPGDLTKVSRWWLLYPSCIGPTDLAFSDLGLFLCPLLHLFRGALDFLVLGHCWPAFPFFWLSFVSSSPVGGSSCSSGFWPPLAFVLSLFLFGSVPSSACLEELWTLVLWATVGLCSLPVCFVLSSPPLVWMRFGRACFGPLLAWFFVRSWFVSVPSSVFVEVFRSVATTSVSRCGYLLLLASAAFLVGLWLLMRSTGVLFHLRGGLLTSFGIPPLRLARPLPSWDPRHGALMVTVSSPFCSLLAPLALFVRPLPYLFWGAWTFAPTVVGLCFFSLGLLCVPSPACFGEFGQLLGPSLAFPPLLLGLLCVSFPTCFGKGGFVMLEGYHPNRVVRQFGFSQVTAYDGRILLPGVTDVLAFSLPYRPVPPESTARDYLGYNFPLVLSWSTVRGDTSVEYGGSGCLGDRGTDTEAHTIAGATVLSPARAIGAAPEPLYTETARSPLRHASSPRVLSPRMPVSVHTSLGGPGDSSPRLRRSDFTSFSTLDPPDDFFFPAYPGESSWSGESSGAGVDLTAEFSFFPEGHPTDLAGLSSAPSGFPAGSTSPLTALEGFEYTSEISCHVPLLPDSRSADRCTHTTALLKDLIFSIDPRSPSSRIEFVPSADRLLVLLVSFGVSTTELVFWESLCRGVQYQIRRLRDFSVLRTRVTFTELKEIVTRRREAANNIHDRFDSSVEALRRHWKSSSRMDTQVRLSVEAFQYFEQCSET